MLLNYLYQVVEQRFFVWLEKSNPNFLFVMIQGLQNRDLSSFFKEIFCLPDIEFL